MAILIDGKATSAAIREEIRTEAEILTKNGTQPGLAVIIAGDDPASKIYVRNKKKACEEVGFYSEEYSLPGDVTEAELSALIDRLNNDNKIHGILVQSPLPKHLDEKRIVARILPSKDVDAFSEENVGKITLGTPRFLPCTPAGIMELLERYNIETKGKHAVVVGRSNIVGKPMALLLLEANCTVTVCHSKTTDLAKFTREADILVAAVGKSRLIKGDMIKDGAVIIDVGMNRDENGKLTGDVAFDECEGKASFITPVPGGVGPMTITMLLKNTLTSAKEANKNSK